MSSFNKRNAFELDIRLSKDVLYLQSDPPPVLPDLSETPDKLLESSLSGESQPELDPRELQACPLRPPLVNGLKWGNIREESDKLQC